MSKRPRRLPPPPTVFPWQRKRGQRQHVRTLDLGGGLSRLNRPETNRIGRKGMEALAKAGAAGALEGLERLDYSWLFFSRSVVLPRNVPRLVHLSLAYATTTDGGVALLDGLGPLPQLESLSVAGLGLKGPAGARALQELLPRLPALRRLDASSNPAVGLLSLRDGSLPVELVLLHCFERAELPVDAVPRELQLLHIYHNPHMPWPVLARFPALVELHVDASFAWAAMNCAISLPQLRRFAALESSPVGGRAVVGEAAPRHWLSVAGLERLTHVEIGQPVRAGGLVLRSLEDATEVVSRSGDITGGELAEAAVGGHLAKVHTLRLHRSSLLEDIPVEFFQHTPALRVLSLRFCRRLRLDGLARASEMGLLGRLQSLDLRDCGFGAVPASLEYQYGLD